MGMVAVSITIESQGQIQVCGNHQNKFGGDDESQEDAESSESIEDSWGSDPAEECKSKILNLYLCLVSSFLNHETKLGFDSLSFDDARLITKVNQDNRRRDAWNSRNKDGRRSGKQEDSKALVTIDGYGVYDVEPVTQKKRR
ncbi:hypothetical protein Tco_0558203 [Tanacetum coccineum]